MHEKKAVSKELRKRYEGASKKEKGAILGEFCLLTGYNRVYAARTLRQRPRPGAHLVRRRKRKKIYGEETLGPLKKVWATMDFACGRRMAPFMPEIVPILESYGELEITPEQREKLLTISSATIDRALRAERRKLEIKPRGGTKPGSLLKNQIPVRTFSQWDEDRPGFVEIDLVGHDGGSVAGDYCQTLDVTDVCTGWTETRAVQNKAQKWVFAALKDAESFFPFPVLGIDSDNGSEFINDQLLRYCKDQRITFTRSRAYRKNDSCYVEQKNYSIIRKTVGYYRHDTEVELALLNELYSVLRLHTNFFRPNLKLIEKTRIGSRTTRRYDTAKTPYQRVLASTKLSQDVKARLASQYAALNPAALMRTIARLQRKLYRHAALKEQLRRKEATAALAKGCSPEEPATQPLGYILT